MRLPLALLTLHALPLPAGEAPATLLAQPDKELLSDGLAQESKAAPAPAAAAKAKVKAPAKAEAGK